MGMILGLALLLLNTGDCVNLVFADAKEAECCMGADCPFAATEQMDSCCKTPTAPATYIQTAAQRSILQRAATYVDFPLEEFAAPIVKIAPYFSADAKLHSPPGGLNAINTPLLI